MKKILFVGDSITDVARSRDNDYYMGGGYATMVAGELGRREPYAYMFKNRGISGNRIVDLHARIRKDIINLQPDYISILIGINDVWHEYTGQNGVCAEKFEILYDMMIRELQQDIPGVKIMILEPFVLPGSKTRTAEEYPARWEFFSSETPLRAAAAKRIAEKYDLVYIPLQKRFDTVNADAPDGYWLIDGVHPTAAGHMLIKEAWLEGFEKLIEKN